MSFVRAKTQNSLKISRLSVPNESFQIPIIKRYNVTKEMIKVVCSEVKPDPIRYEGVMLLLSPQPWLQASSATSCAFKGGRKVFKQSLERNL